LPWWPGLEVGRALLRVGQVNVDKEKERQKDQGPAEATPRSQVRLEPPVPTTSLLVRQGRQGSVVSISQSEGGETGIAGRSELPFLHPNCRSGLGVLGALAVFKRGFEG